MIFQMAAAAILNFQKFEILMVFPLYGANMRHHATFHQHWSNGCMQRYGDLTVFKMAAVRHLGFVKFDFLTVGSVKRPIFHQRPAYQIS